MNSTSITSPTLQQQVSSLKQSSLFWVKWANYEYWPFWAFYFPVSFYGIYLALKSKSLTYFTAVNPSIELGGIMGESKIDILRMVNPAYLPKTLLVEKQSDTQITLMQMQHQDIQFPVIAKPNVGERGNGVSKLLSAADLHTYLQNTQESFLIQEYIDYPLELGVLYYRFPDGSQSGITSIVQKEFLSVEGDGKSSILALMQKNDRARFQIERLQRLYGKDYMESILEKGKKQVLEPIGNHCRGTKFMNANHLISPHLVQIFDTIASSMQGFYYGRFDLRVKDIEALYQGKSIKIMEVNGVTSEPGHVYDPNYTLLQAYKDVMQNMAIIQKVSVQNHQRGIPYASWGEVWKAVKGIF